MASAISKRQQARNEKALHDLVDKVPGNNFCADCQTRNPAWASWSLGVFLCMRCASIHRKLGTHISKVKSLTMDSWSNEQVENMRKVGNVASNKIYNPQNKRPQIPVDADEADSVMERFIRQKYMSSSLNVSKRHNTGSTESDEGIPPAVPPKTPGKFGFRSASSIFPIGSRAKKEAAIRNLSAQMNVPRSPSPRLGNKPSEVFGASVGSFDDEDIESKMTRLRDMGFTDSEKNLMMLRQTNGSIERAIEALVRLGDNGRNSPASLTSPREQSLRATRSLTPITPTSNLGPSLQARQDRPITPSTISSNNPFDRPPTAQPQTAQSTGNLQNKNPYYPNNPFDIQTQQQDMTQAFQNMGLAPQQPLFPHHTGGIPASQPTMQPLYQQSMTPPVPSMPNFVSMPSIGSLSYPQPAQSTTSYNPFFSQSQSPPQMQHQQVLTVNTATMPGAYGNNPFTRSPTRINSPPLGQIPEQMQQNFFVTPSPPAVAPTATNPFFAQQAAQSQQQLLMQQQQQQQAQYAVQMPQMSQMSHMPQQPGYQPAYQTQRPDKASIMALYNYPHLAPQQPVKEDSAQPEAFPNVSQSAQATAQPQPQPQPSTTTSTTSPVAGSKNPFLAGMTSPAPPQPMAAGGAAVGSADNIFGANKGHYSRESVALGMDMTWTNGRHSPDAFASLSARHV